MLLERDESLQKLLGIVDNAKENTGQETIALVSGEAGIGKTTLLNAFREQLRHLHQHEVEVLWGGSDPLFTPRSLGPLHDMAPLFNDDIRLKLKEGANVSLLFDELLSFLKKRSRTYVLIFEDVHWSDHGTLDFLKFLARRISFINAVLVISYRSDEVDTAHPLNDVLANLPPTKTCRLELEALSLNALRKLLKDGSAENDDQALLEITGGNPFFVTELLASKNSTAETVPASIRDAVSARINRLNKDEQNFLETISLIPKAVHIDLLLRLFPNDAEVYAMACVGRGLLTIVGADSFRFRHELARLGTLARVSVFEKQRLHTKILAALLELNTDPEIEHMVHHALGALNAEKVLEYAPQAAVIASAAGAHREAAAHLSSAIRFIECATAEQAAELYESWAKEAGLTMDDHSELIAARQRAISLWRALGNTAKVGENLRWLARLYRDNGQAAESARTLDEAIKTFESIPPSSERAMAYSLRSQYFMLNDQMDDAVYWGNKALELESQFSDVKVKTHALNNIGTAKAFRNHTDGLDLLYQSLHLSLEHNLDVNAARAYNNLSEALIKNRDFDAANEIISEGIAYLNKHDLDSWVYYLIGRFAELRFMQGRMSEAKVIADNALAMDQLTVLMKFPALLVDAKLSSVTKQVDRHEKLKYALECAIATDEVQHIIPAHLAIIESAWFTDDSELASLHLDELSLLDESLADVWTIGEIVIWSKRHKLNKPYKYTVTLPLPYQLEIDGKYADAADQWESLGMPYQAALALAQTSDPHDFHLFNRALKLLEPVGATAVVEKIKKRASKLSITDRLDKFKRGPYRSAKAHPMGFTKKEQEIFKYVIEGASNRQIGEVLNRSQRTIEHHVSSILRKLKVETRMEAMLRAQNEPWLAGK